MNGAVHPQVARVAALLRGAGLVPREGADIETVRADLERLAAFASVDSVPLPGERLLSVPAPGRAVPCKLYPPEGGAPPGLLLYCHGGGFRHGTLAGWDAPLRQLVRDSGLAVLSIEYALAPEYPFPAAFEEVVAVASQVMAEGGVAGLSVARFALGGDSAGANLALAAALALRDAGVEPLAYLLLFYGVYAKETDSASWRLGGVGGQGLSAASMREYWRTYLPDDDSDWRVQPLHGDLRGLPATRLVVGELDPLLDQNRALHGELENAGVASELVVAPGLIHGVLRFNELASVVRDLIAEEARALARFFR